MTRPLSVEKVESLERLRALGPDWDRLEQSCGNTLPFSTFAWNMAWWQHLRSNELSVRDELFVRAVRGAGGELVAVAPLMLTERPGVGPMRARIVQFFGADPNVTELRGLISTANEAPFAAQALLDSLRAERHRWDWMLWAGLPAGSDVLAVVEQHRPVIWSRDVPVYLLPLPESWDEFRAGLKHNIKESLRKCYNSLKRDNLSIEFDVVSDRSALGSALEHFYRLHAARAQTEGTVFHRNRFGTAPAQRFLNQVCDELAPRGAALVFVLRLSGIVVAARVAFLFGDTLYMYYSGYEVDYGKYSVMTTLVAEAIKWAIGRGVRTVNLSTGTDVSKTRWGPLEAVYREGTQLAPTSRGRIAYDVYQLAMRAQRNGRVRNIVRRFLRRRWDEA